MPEHKTCKQIDDFCNNYRDVNCVRVLIDFFSFSLCIVFIFCELACLDIVIHSMLPYCLL